MNKELICVVCPMSCKIEVTYENGKVTTITGYQCSRGKEYSQDEVVAPKRTLTTTVLLEGGDLPLL